MKLSVIGRQFNTRPRNRVQAVSRQLVVGPRCEGGCHKAFEKQEWGERGLPKVNVSI